MGAACCAGSALAGGGGGTGAASSPDALLALPLALYDVAPRATIALSLLTLLTLALGYLLLLLLTPHPRPPTHTELTYLSPAHPASPQPLPTLKDKASVQLSVVIPAYNERQRLPAMLTDSLKWLEARRDANLPLVAPSAKAHANGHANGKADDAKTKVSACEESRALGDPLQAYEVIVVDDGSKDGTVEVALDTAKAVKLKQGAEVRVVRLEQNRGKGGAVRHGILHARGSLILFADADGATKFDDLSRLCAEMQRIVTPAGHGIVVGSRAHMVKSDAVVKRSFIRNLLMHMFHLFLTLLLHPPTPRLPSFLGRLTGTNGPRRHTSGGGGTTTTTTTTVRKLARQPAIQDTQCGFKLFTRTSSALLLPLCHIDRWIFDVEILVLAEMACRSNFSSVLDARRGGGGGGACVLLDSETKATAEEKKKKEEKLDGEGDEDDDALLDLHLPVAEVAVDWQEVGGSKIDLVKDSIGMAIDLLVIRANYALGRWEAPVIRS